MRMGVSLAARKHPVLTTLRDTKAQVMPVGEVALSIPSSTIGEPGFDDIPEEGISPTRLVASLIKDQRSECLS